MRLNLGDPGAEPMHSDRHELCGPVVNIVLGIYFGKLDHLRISERCGIFYKLDELARFKAERRRC